MNKTTIFSFARYCMNDDEFLRGGIPSGEKDFLDALGMDYDTDENGVITGTSGDVARFYNALWILRDLSQKYPQGDNK